MIRNRKIGPVLATALVASNMIGSGIFLLPAPLATVGSITVVGWAIGTVGALLIATILAKLRQDCESEAAAAQLEAKILKEVFGKGHAVPHTLYINYCITHSV